MQYELIVFDCDGVLVDSEALVIDVEATLLTQAGFPITADEIADQFVGLSYRTMMEELAAQHGKPVPEELSESIQQAALAEFPERLQAVEGMPDLLAHLSLPKCVASSSDLDRINLSLSLTGLDAHFAPEVIFSAQMVQNGKPAPDLFELAASTVGFGPDTCLVIEDSPSGVAAACAANMDVVGLVAGGHARPSLEQRLREAGASHVFATVKELAAHLAH